MGNLKELISQIKHGDTDPVMICQQHLDNIAKPLGSLGELEHLLCIIAGATGTDKIDISKKCVLVYCSDNGVVDQGISQSDHTVTTNIAKSLANNHSSVCVMANACMADTFPIDIGMIDDVPEIRQCKIANGTKDFTNEPAMTRKQAEDAILIGINMVREKTQLGYKLIATGEAGIGNTTTSSAVVSALLNLDTELTTGRGSGLSDEGLKRKIKAINEGLSKNKPDFTDPIDILSKVGGFDIAAMCGTFLGGALTKTPVVIDGIISSVAALCAYRLCPQVRDYMIPSHKSAEPAAKYIMEELRLSPILDAGMRLGEGTGAVSLFPFLDMAVAVYNDAARFEDINVEQYRRLS